MGTDARSRCSGTPGSGLLEPPTAPFVLPAFHPLQLRPSWPNPAAAPARGSAPRPSGFQQQQLGGPAAPTPLPLHRALPRTAAAPGEGAGGLGDPGDQRLARVARVLPSRPPRACHLGLSSSPPRRPTGSKPQAGPPRVPVLWSPPPRAPYAGPSLPRCPASVSTVLARVAPENSPKLAKFAPPARRPPLTGGKGRCARAQSPRRPPPTRCMSWRLGSARWRALSQPGGRLSPGAPGPVPVVRPGGLSRVRPAPLRGPPGAPLHPGLRCAPPPAPRALQPAVAKLSLPPAPPAPPGPTASAPPWPARPAAGTRAPPAPPCHPRADAWVLSLLSRAVLLDPTLGAKVAS